jgi:hypothetical protein
MPIMLPGTMSDAGHPPLDDDEADRERKAKAVMLMGQHGNLMGQAAKGLASADPNSPDYLSRVGHGIRQMHLMRSITPAIESAMSPTAAKPADAGNILPAGGPRPDEEMGKTSLMGNLPLTRRNTNTALLASPAAASPSESAEPTTLSPSLMGPGMPTVMRPSRHASIEAGKREYQEGLPQVTAPAGSPEAYSQEMARMGYQEEHPWGAPVSAHPGFWGKVGHVAARMGNIAGDVFAPGTMSLIPETQLGREREYAEARRGLMGAERAQSELMDAEARMGEVRNRMGAAPKERTVEINGQPVVQSWRGDRGWVTEPGVAPYAKQGQLSLAQQEGRDVDELLGQTNPATGKPYTRTEAIVAVRGAASPQKERIFTNPFQASLYGTPEQKKAAQDFLAFEKKLGTRYQRPTEFEEKYRLFNEHPDIYKAMFGTKGGISPAEARMMLNYFDKRKQEINKDYTLSDADRQQALAEVEQLEQPFMDAAQRAAAPGAGAPEGDTVNVISPTGVPGTIPRKNLEKALRGGYKLANQ